MSSRRTFFPLLVSALLAAAWVALAQAPTGSAAKVAPRPPGTLKMARMLAEIDRAQDPRANTFINDRRLAWIRSIPEPSPPEELMRYLFIVGQDELLAGESAAATKTFERILALAADGVEMSAGAARQVRGLAALAHLRRGEQENCLLAHNIERCLLPIRGQGVHTAKEGSTAAAALYAALLSEDPNDLGARWLLNIAHMTLGQYPKAVPEALRVPPEAFASKHDVGRFEDVAPNVGLDVLGLSGGSLMEDLDGDGDLDLMASAWGLGEPLRFFVNNGNGSFTERTREAGLEGLTGGLNLVQADYDNDGLLDVLVLRGAWLGDAGRHPNSLLRNLGGTFADVTEEARLLSRHPTQVAAWADYDGDGWVDLFIGNETVAREKSEHPAELYRNNGNGTFTNVAERVGLAVTAFIKGAVWGDIDNDGRPDLFVSDMAGGNLLFHNRGPRPNGGWAFENIAGRAGVTEPRISFPTWFWDYDNDGFLDLFVSGYSGGIEAVAADYLGLPGGGGEKPRLYRNRGDGTFEDRTVQAGLDVVLVTMGCNFGDLDNDGFLDFYAGTGDTEMRSLMPNRMFRSDGGKGFQDVTTSGGFGHLQKGHGIAFGDLDNDGDQDIYAVMGGAHSGDGFHNALFQNPGHGNRWLALRLEGLAANRDAIGARIQVRAQTAAGPRDVYATVSSGGSFGASSLRQEIGLGQAEAISWVEVRWPGDEKPQRATGFELDRAYRLLQDAERPELVELEPFTLGGGSQIGHKHVAQ